ncbi:DedA family protein [Halalkalicoccus salilacus]|uniref:DedA family protein n=1 Tax=Halalkalicoccus sp. GCM10025704 TaxID=3252662 RepID=UPI00362368A6
MRKRSVTGDAPASAIHLASRFGAFDRRILDSRRARSVMVDLGTTALRFVQLYGPLALLVFTFLEASMLFPFLPSEVVVPAAAVLVQDAASFVVFVGAAGVGGTVGAFVPYYVFRGPGSRGTGRLGEYLHVSERSKERARRWFLEWGVTSVLWGRFLPGLRSVISIPAGLVGMNAAWFGALTAIGTVAFYAASGRSSTTPRSRRSLGRFVSWPRTGRGSSRCSCSVCWRRRCCSPVGIVARGRGGRVDDCAREKRRQPYSCYRYRAPRIRSTAV